VDLTAALAQVEASLTHQLALAGGEQALGVDGAALYAAMEPALRQLGMTVAQQAATEVGAQLPEHEVDVVVSDGEPAIRVRPARSDADSASFDDLDARLTLRLPEALKRLVEAEAGDAGDSVNTFVIRTLSSKASRRGRHQSGAQSGEFHT
jgi:hypothetical protein